MNEVIRCPSCLSPDIGQYKSKKLGMFCRECGLKFDPYKDADEHEKEKMKSYNDGIRKMATEILFYIQYHEKRNSLFYRKGFDFVDAKIKELTDGT